LKLEFTKREYEYFVENCGFTADEKVVLDHIRDGKSYDEISDEMYICKRSVGNKVKKIKTKIIKVIMEKSS
jgi:DNA-binding NarL/FixJ family response regulator